MFILPLSFLWSMHVLPVQAEIYSNFILQLKSACWVSRYLWIYLEYECIKARFTGFYPNNHKDKLKSTEDSLPSSPKKDLLETKKLVSEKVRK